MAEKGQGWKRSRLEEDAQPPTSTEKPHIQIVDEAGQEIASLHRENQQSGELEDPLTLPDGVSQPVSYSI